MEDNIQSDINAYIGKKASVKKRVNSIKKGKDYERNVAKMISESIGIEICRVPMSGGFSSLHNTETFSGDLMAVHNEDYMPFVLECKAYKDINLLDLLNENKKTNPIFEWIQQSEREGVATGKIPFIIFKINNSATHILSQMKNFVKGDSEFYLKDKNKRIIFHYKGNNYFIVTYDNFLITDLYNNLKDKHNNK